MCGAEGAEEGVEVVGGGGKVEEGRGGEFGGEVGVEFGHAGNGQRLLDAEGVVQDSERGGRLRDFDGVVDVADDGPAGGGGEVGSAFEGEGGWEVGGEALDLGGGGAVLLAWLAHM